MSSMWLPSAASHGLLPQKQKLSLCSRRYSQPGPAADSRRRKGGEQFSLLATFSGQRSKIESLNGWHDNVKGISESVAAPAACLFPLAEGQSRMFQKLPSGLRLEVIFQLQQHQGASAKTPIVFIHGSYHAAWCWAEHWLPFFAKQGHDCYAISLLGQGGSDTPSAKTAGNLQSHARDVAYFIQNNLDVAPILVGHSFGGLIVQYYLGQMSSTVACPPNVLPADHFPRLAAAMLICSVPPTGNGGVVQRYVRSRPIAAIKVTFSLAAKAFANSLSLCRETFFSADMPDGQVKRYQKLLKESSRVPLLDLRELNSSLPVAVPSTNVPPILVVGSEKDFLVDLEGVCETQEFYGVNKVIIPGVAHDLMLDMRWEEAALIISRWIASMVNPDVRSASFQHKN